MVVASHSGDAIECIRGRCDAFGEHCKPMQRRGDISRNLNGRGPLKRADICYAASSAGNMRISETTRPSRTAQSKLVNEITTQSLIENSVTRDKDGRFIFRSSGDSIA